jgi:hypothetical protein
MDIYQKMLEELGYDCSDWEYDTTEKEKTPNEPCREIGYNIWKPPEEIILVLDYHEEQARLYNIRKSAVYKRLTHFKEHLRRLQGLEIVTWPSELLKLARKYPYNWKDPNMYEQCRSWMKRVGIARKYYEHIFLLARLMGGYQITVPNYLEYKWVYNFPKWDRLFQYYYGTTHTGKRNFPRYHVLFHVLFTAGNLDPVYKLPSISEKRFSELYAQLYEIIFCL